MSTAALREEFAEIYDRSLWGRDGGTGSSPEFAAPYLAFLQRFLVEHGIKSVVDCGCGDWRLGSSIDWSGIDYTGLDVVPAIIEHNQREHARENVRFRCEDFTRAELPSADLVLCKDTLQHLSSEDAARFLRTLGRFKYALLTNDQGTNDGRDARLVSLHRYAPIDLQGAPFYVNGKIVCTLPGRKITVLWTPECVPASAVEPPTLPAEAPAILVAIIVKQAASFLGFYLECLRAQDYPKSRIHLWIRTNNNTDDTASILRAFVAEHGPAYASVTFDDADVLERVEDLEAHEWTPERFRVLGEIRQQSLAATVAHGCDFYFCADADNFLRPFTLRALVALNLPIVAPLLHHESDGSAYSNFHAAVDKNGYYAAHESYAWAQQQRVRGLLQMPVVHCTYLVRADAIPKLTYADGSGRYEYVVFSDSARRAGVEQYLDTREMYGFIHLSSLWCGRAERSLGAEVRAALEGRTAPVRAVVEPKGPNEILRSDYGPIVVNRHDIWIGASIRRTGYWAADDIRLILRLLASFPDHVTFYDVGANIGTHTLAIAKTLGAKVTVRAFEAQRRIFDMLQETVRLNGLTNVQTHLNAVSDVDGWELEIAVPDYDEVNNFGGIELITPKVSDNARVRKPGIEVVRTVTLDSFDEAVDFIKLDIEGMEDRALRGAVKTIERCRPVCFVEVHKTDGDFVRAFFKQRGYDGFARGQDLVAVPRERGIVLDDPKIF